MLRRRCADPGLSGLQMAARPYAQSHMQKRVHRQLSKRLLVWQSSGSSDFAGALQLGKPLLVCIIPVTVGGLLAFGRWNVICELPSLVRV